MANSPLLPRDIFFRFIPCQTVTTVMRERRDTRVWYSKYNVASTLRVLTEGWGLGFLRPHSAISSYYARNWTDWFVGSSNSLKNVILIHRCEFLAREGISIGSFSRRAVWIFNLWLIMTGEIPYSFSSFSWYRVVHSSKRKLENTNIFDITLRKFWNSILLF